MSSNPIKSITDLEFDNLTFESATPVLVFFGAERCSVCKELQPVVEEVMVEYNDRLTVYMVDVDNYKSLVSRLRLRGIPQILVFKDGEVKGRMGGLRTKEELSELIDGII